MPILYRSTPVNEPFTFESIGINWNQERVFRPNGFPFFQYLQTETGAGRIYVGNNNYVLNQNEGILIAPFIRHSYERISESWYTRFISFTGTMQNSIAQLLNNRSVILISSDQSASVSVLLETCYRHCTDLTADKHQMSVICYSLLLRLADNLHNYSPEDEPLYNQYLLPVLKEIETNYPLELTVDMLAGLVYITPQYLSRLFRRYLNCSTYEYLTSYRISRAKEFLISHPHMEIREIARSTGYTDASHFTVIFKKLTGLTPLEFRKTNGSVT